MRCSLNRLQTDVMARLGERARPQAVAVTSGVPWPEDIVALKVSAFLAEEGSRIIREAPVGLLGCGVVGLMGCEVVSRRKMPCGLYAAEVRMPDDFLRMVSVKMSGWLRGAVDVAFPGSAGWERQWSAESGIAGCPERPRAYLDADGSGLLLRLVGSESESDSLEWLSGWCVPEADNDGEFDFPDGLYPELVAAVMARL